MTPTAEHASQPARAIHPDPAVLAEVRRRSTDHDAGKTTPAPASDLLAKLRARLAGK